MLEAESICYAIDGESILQDVSIRVLPGQMTVVIGPSGAGKTTLLRCLSLLATPFSGSLRVDDTAFDFPLRHAVKPPWPDVTAVFQQHFLWPHLTLRENILLPLKLNRLAHQARVDELIQVLDLGSFIDRYPKQSSLGQRQRAAIARALALDPRYVLLDEITSALDVEQSYAILHHLLELKRRGIGILIITHHLEFARAILRADPADHFVFLEAGSVVETGSAATLTQPKSQRVARFLEKMEFKI